MNASRVSRVSKVIACIAAAVALAGVSAAGVEASPIAPDSVQNANSGTRIYSGNKIVQIVQQHPGERPEVSYWYSKPNGCGQDIALDGFSVLGDWTVRVEWAAGQGAPDVFIIPPGPPPASKQIAP